MSGNAMEVEEITKRTADDGEAPSERSALFQAMEAELEAAAESEEKAPNVAVEKYRRILDTPDPKNALAKLKEEAIYALGKLFIKLSRTADFKELFVKIRPFFNTVPKARTAKIVRALIDLVGEDASGLSMQSEICEDAIAWCKAEKRSFLKQRIQAKLANLYYKQRRFNDALSLLAALIREVRRFDDKLLMVEIYLIESKTFFALENYQKSKASLTAARSSANAIYCPPAMQADIDLQAGVLCAKESDWKTAFSYFFEAFESFQTIKDDKHALQSLKYMILSKILLNAYDDVSGIISGKSGVKFSGPALYAMRAVADAYKARSVEQFEHVYRVKFAKELQGDSVIADHLSELKEALLEQNLQKLIEPFSRVQIEHIAKLIAMPRATVEAKLSEMILDKKLNGILDQGAGDLIVFNAAASDKAYAAAIDTCKELGSCIDRLYAKAKKLTA